MARSLPTCMAVVHRALPGQIQMSTSRPTSGGGLRRLFRSCCPPASTLWCWTMLLWSLPAGLRCTESFFSNETLVLVWFGRRRHARSISTSCLGLIAPTKISQKRCCVVVDEVRVFRLLRAITDDLALLREEFDAGEARRADRMWLRGVKYTFVTSIEACVDVAQHICSAQGWGPPQDNGDAMKVLARHGMLSAELSDAMRKAVGFRNVLVHEYVEVSDEIVVSRLGNLGDLERFVEQVTAFLRGGPGVAR